MSYDRTISECYGQCRLFTDCGTDKLNRSTKVEPLGQVPWPLKYYSESCNIKTPAPCLCDSEYSSGAWIWVWNWFKWQGTKDDTLPPGCHMLMFSLFHIIALTKFIGLSRQISIPVILLCQSRATLMKDIWGMARNIHTIVVLINLGTMMLHKSIYTTFTSMW